MAPTRTSKLQRKSKRTSPKPPVQDRVVCPDCGCSVNRRTDLPRHRKRHDPDAVRYYCQYPGCDFSCLQKSALKPHGNKHSQQKTESCLLCLHSFADGSSLSRHRQKEHGHQPHHTKAYLEAKANQAGASKKNAKKNASQATSSSAVRAEKRDKRRVAPYGVPAQAARSAAKAKRAGKESSNAFSFAEPFYAPSNPVHESSPFSNLSDLLTSLPPLSPCSASSSFTISSGPGTPKELSPPPSGSWNDFSATIMDPSMPQCPPFLVRDPMYGYEVSPTDGDWAASVQQGTKYYGASTFAPIPAQHWAGADVNSQMLYNPAPAAPALAPETLFYTTAFQGAPVSYNALPLAQHSMPGPCFNGTYDQYAPPQVEQLQPAASQALSELAAGMGLSEQQMALWLDEIAQGTPAFGTL